MVLLGFFISRCLSGYAILQFPCAKKKGLAATFATGAQKTIVKRVLMGWIILASILLLWIYLLWGAVLLGIIAVSYFIFYRWMRKEFGGMTGDLAGFCLQIIELLCLIVAAIMGGITA
jgi:adenosylcobinamide-GDP ribazoletransferase